MLQSRKGFEFDNVISRQCLLAMKELFDDKGFQKLIERGNEYNLHENLQ